MPTRLGIEVSAGYCRLVVTDTWTHTAHQTTSALTHVLKFHSFTWDSTDASTLTAGLKAARGIHKLPKQAWVTLWDLALVHRFLQLPPASPSHLDALARREAAPELSRFGSDPEATTSNLVLGRTVEDAGYPRREVAFIASPTADIEARLDPIVSAGFSVHGVLTPSMALVSLARLLPAGTPGTPVAYLALGASATSLVIVRDGQPLFARELPWGYHGRARLPDAEALSERLASELRRSFLFFKQSFKTGVDVVVTCGDYRDLRSLTAPLIEHLGIEVQTLDTLAGIDITTLPSPASRFREEVAGLRLAWAAAADGVSPVNLLPRRVLAARSRRRQMLIAAAGAAASLALAAAMYIPADRQANVEVARVEQLRQQLARVEPLARERDQAIQSSIEATAQRAALAALGEHGPRLARALEHLAAGAPEGLTVTSLAIRSDGAQWRAAIRGVALAGDAAVGQALVNQFLHAVANSPYFGETIAPPTLRVLSGGDGPSPGNVRSTVTDDRSGVEFTVDFSLPR